MGIENILNLYIIRFPLLAFNFLQSILTPPICSFLFQYPLPLKSRNIIIYFAIAAQPDPNPLRVSP